MSVPAHVVKEVEELIHPSCTLPMNHRLQNVLRILEDINFVYSTVLKPEALICHPHNRGGSMINAHNAYLKGFQIEEMGLRPELLPANSLALEISMNQAQRTSQFQSNKKMVADSKGLLASIKGDERFMTLSNSHFIQWSRAVQAGLRAPDGTQLLASPQMKELLQSGWQWKVIVSQAEVTWPGLPAFACMSMNSSNTNQVASNELETMLKLSELYQAGFKMDDAIVEVQRSSPSCKAYMVDVAFFCRMFTGGSTFPLLRCLDMFCTLLPKETVYFVYFAPKHCLLSKLHRAWFASAI